jgi:hypothetical protein
MMADDPKPTLRLVSSRAKAWEFESLDRWGPRPRYRQRALAQWRGSGVGARGGVHIPTQTESVPDGKES